MRSAPLILVVDDDSGFQEIIASKLKRSGFLIAEAHDGIEAIDKAVNLHPDLVLMDINMPGENGTEAVLDLLKNQETKDIKIAFLTSQTDPWPAAKGGAEGLAKELGARKFINKSEDLDEIASKVKEILKS